MWAVWVVACSSVPLSEITIDGGTPEMQRGVEQLLASFEAAVGPGRIELRALKIRSTDRFFGRYNPTNRTVTVSESAYPLTHVVYHELCHALFDQQDLGRTLRRDPGPMDRVVDQLFSDDRGPPHRLPLPTPSRRRSEAVATLCSQGPYWAADATRDVCGSYGDDQALAREAAGWMLEHVWSAFTLPEPLVLDPADEIASEVGTFGVPPAAVAGTADPHIIVAGGEHLDLYSGRTVTSDLPALDREGGVPVGLGIWLTGETAAAGWPDGPAAVVGTWLPYPLFAGSHGRLLAHDGEAWRFVGDGCGEGATSVFTADDRLWVARWDEERGLVWTALGER